MKIKSKVSKITVFLLLITCCCLSVTACSSSTSTNNKSTVKTSTEKKGPITIKYVGNSCFYITFGDGTRLITDPYGSGFASTFGTFPSLTADVITFSHSHGDHTAGQYEVKGDPKLIQPEDLNKTIKVNSVEITGYASKHVANMGDNTIFVYKQGGYKIVHMGETDNIDSPEAKAAVKDADVILAYAGEYGTVKNKDSFANLNSLNIKVITPQHFSMDANKIFYNEPTIDDILKELPEGTKVTNADEIVVKKDMEKQFVVLSTNWKNK